MIVREHFSATPELCGGNTMMNGETTREMLRNPYGCKTEGMRRASVALSVIALGIWFGWVGVASDGFSKVHLQGWAILFGAPVCVYVAIMALRYGVLWVIDGFRADKHGNGKPLL